MSFWSSKKSFEYKVPPPRVDWTWEDRKFHWLGGLLFLVIWPIILLLVSMYLRGKNVTDINPLLSSFANSVLHIVPEAAMRPYYQNVATNLYHTGIIMAVGWFIFVPNVLLMIWFNESSFFIPVERTFPYGFGYRPVWASLFFRMLIACGFTYLFVFHGFYVDKLRRLHTATSLLFQGFIATLFSTIASMTVGVIINTGYQVWFKMKGERS
jgi:hypothetical protein